MKLFLKIYIRVIYFLILVVGPFGFLFPAMISSKSNELVIGGQVLMIAILPLIVYLVVNIIQIILKHFSNEESN